MATPKKILIVKLSSLGDLFHALPAAKNLKEEMHAEIHWVTQPEYVDLVGSFPMVSRVISFPRRQMLAGFGRFVQELRRERYDIIVDLQGLLKSALVSRLARGDVRVGPSFSREGARLFYSAVAGPANRSRHAVQENLDVVRYFGLRVLPVSFEVGFPDLVCDLPRPRIGIIPVSRWSNKNWPSARYSEAVLALLKTKSVSIALFGAADDSGVCAEICSRITAVKPGAHVVNLAGKTTLLQMAGWLSRMDAVVANDSGPLHMAVAAGVPVIAIFGPTDPMRTGPYGDANVVCTANVGCRPCHARVCPLPEIVCMTELSVKQVSDGIEKIIARYVLCG